jgi:hypothetical protein
MLYDPLAVKRLASAVCVLPPTPRSRIGTSGCQGCESASTTESSREPGLDAGAPGRLYCVPPQEEEQQRPVVGHGIVLGECPSQENLAQGKGRALGAERSSTEPFRKKDQATYLGSAATYRGGGGLCPPAAWHTTALDVRHEPASFPCWRSACHSPWEPPSCVRMALQDEQPRAPEAGRRLPRFRRKPRAARESRHRTPAGWRSHLTDRSVSDPQSPWGKGENAASDEYAIALGTSGGVVVFT